MRQQAFQYLRILILARDHHKLGGDILWLQSLMRATLKINKAIKQCLPTILLTGPTLVDNLAHVPESMGRLCSGPLISLHHQKFNINLPDNHSNLSNFFLVQKTFASVKQYKE